MLGHAEIETHKALINVKPVMRMRVALAMSGPCSTGVVDFTLLRARIENLPVCCICNPLSIPTSDEYEKRHRFGVSEAFIDMGEVENSCRASMDDDAHYHEAISSGARERSVSVSILLVS